MNELAGMAKFNGTTIGNTGVVGASAVCEATDI